jgi:hypothetical protein
MGEMADWALERMEERACLIPQRGPRTDGIDFSAVLEQEEEIMLEADEQGGVQGPQGDLVEEEHAPVPWHEHQAAVLNARDLSVALEEAKTENEKLRGALGWGPYVIVKLPEDGLRQLAEGQQVRVTVGGGQGVTQHLVGEVLELGVQTVRQTLGPEPAPEQLRERASALLTEASQAEGYTER